MDQSINRVDFKGMIGKVTGKEAKRCCIPMVRVFFYLYQLFLQQNKTTFKTNYKTTLGKNIPKERQTVRSPSTSPC